MTETPESIERAVHAAVLDVAGQQGRSLIEVRDDQHLRDDLGLASLDLAQLVAMLELEIGLDPFAEQVAIGAIQTVGDLCAAYRASFAGEAG